MNVLLLSMPDSFEHMPTVAVRMPNGALCSLAGNIDPHHKVAVADLILVQSKVRANGGATGARKSTGCSGSLRHDFPAQDCASHRQTGAFTATWCSHRRRGL